LKEAGVHYLEGGEVDGLTLAPLVDDWGEEIAAFAVGLVVEVENV
jgi:hypothetical protein